jgi:hypothetical protein
VRSSQRIEPRFEGFGGSGRTLLEVNDRLVGGHHSRQQGQRRESSRVGNKILKRTLANLSDWPASQIDSLHRVLKGDSLVSASDALQIERSLPHGHVAAALGTLRRIGLESDLARAASPERDLICALIVARILAPASKLATARGLHEQTASSSLGALLGLELVDEDHLYEAMDWLVGRQTRLEDKLAARHAARRALCAWARTARPEERKA